VPRAVLAETSASQHVSRLAEFSADWQNFVASRGDLEG
jgi:hypothetical protein